MEDYIIIYWKVGRYDDELSILGYGCMRFPRKNGRIDYKRTEKQIMMAIENGVNYFDTAFIYPGSEKTLGKILKNNDCRDKVKIADKMPISIVKNILEMDSIFEKQLIDLQTNYIDYYMIHNLTNIDEWKKLKEAGILDFVDKKKKKGGIKNFGFSFHGNLHNFKRLIDDYEWEFCMIQYNYIDENYQAGREGLKYATAKDIGVIIMEPLRGGILTNKLPTTVKEIIDNYENKTPAELAFQWLWAQSGVKVVLSGMNNEKHIKDNIKYASREKNNRLTKKEKEMIEKIKKEFKKQMKIDCTNCNYCIPCPHGVDIPICFSSYNDKKMFGGFMPYIMYLTATKYESGAYKCRKCGVCEKKCPQNIAIVDELKEVSKTMDHWYYRALGKVIRDFIYNSALGKVIRDFILR